jgi:hypothetical protein
MIAEVTPPPMATACQLHSDIHQKAFHANHWTFPAVRTRLPDGIFCCSAHVSAQSGGWDHAFSNSGRWEQAFRSTGSQVMGWPQRPLPAGGGFFLAPQFSVFDSSSFISDGMGFGYPGVPCYGGIYRPWPVFIQSPPLPYWRTPWGSTGVLYPTIPLSGGPLVPFCCSGVWATGPCGGVLAFPIVQSFSFQSISIQTGPLPVVGNHRSVATSGQSLRHGCHCRRPTYRWPSTPPIRGS